MGGLKGAIVGAYPDARILDATHDVPSFDIATGAFTFNTTAAAFPRDTILVGAVAPGGSATFLAVTTDRGQIFVVPDNGIITLAARKQALARPTRLAMKTYSASRYKIWAYARSWARWLDFWRLGWNPLARAFQ